jgi:predicted NAD/FAD-dependent oxidoreductase
MTNTKDRVAVIGAGMAGLSCAAALCAQGMAVTLFDKGRGPGGRMSTRRVQTPLGEMAFDHGAQYFTVRDAGFGALVQDLASRGLVAPWPAAGPDAWIGTPGMSAVIKGMATPRDVRWHTTVDRIEPSAEGWLVKAGTVAFAGFDAVVLAVPAEQALPFLSLYDFHMARQAMLARSQPCWTAMFAFARPLPGTTDMVRDRGNLGWAARNLAKPERTGPEGWVVQARPEWSQQHIEDEPAAVASLLLAELSAALGCTLPEPASRSAHRWRYAMNAGLDLGALWNAGRGLGVCGDWLLGPRVECAWLSGQQLAQAMLDKPARAAA